MKVTKSDLKKEIARVYGSTKELKNHLEKNATLEYGSFTNEVIILGQRFSYTSNPNHFATFTVSLNGVGMTKQYALGKSSLTKRGIQRAQPMGAATYITL